MKPPYVWFGGKRAVASQIWDALGDVPHYIEPFFGGGAVYWLRPESHTNSLATLNDLDGYISNFLRATQADPETVARFADYPPIEVDLHARHDWLVKQAPVLNELIQDPEWYDAKIAGWWLWGINNWIGSGWCDVARYTKDDDTRTTRKLPHLTGTQGTQSVRADSNLFFEGTFPRSQALLDYIRTLSHRLFTARVINGDWQRVLTPAVCRGLREGQLTGIFLDPPYDLAVGRDMVYSHETQVSEAVREWAIANGDNPNLRIVLAGYADEHSMPESWRVLQWKANGGYGNQSDIRGKANASRECLWFSPHCIKPLNQPMLF